jgi:hypothetical protein
MFAGDASGQLPGSTDIATFPAGAGTLTLDERRLLVDQALVLFEQNYAHLPLKVAMYAVNPMQRLRLLRARLEHQTPTTMSPEWVFHSELSEIFHSVHDLHTNYLLPLPFSGKIAYLPFQVEEWLDDGGSRYVVSRLAQGFSPPGFTAGVEITHWNGVPMDRPSASTGPASPRATPPPSRPGPGHLDVELAATATQLTVRIDALGAERAEFYVGTRPRATVDLPGAGGSATAQVTAPAAGTPLRIDGFSTDELVASRTVTV